MSKKIQSKIEELLFEVYEKGLQQETANLTAYYKKIEQVLNLPVVSSKLPTIHDIDQAAKNYTETKLMNGQHKADCRYSFEKGAVWMAKQIKYNCVFTQCWQQKRYDISFINQNYTR